MQYRLITVYPDLDEKSKNRLFSPGRGETRLNSCVCDVHEGGLLTDIIVVSRACSFLALEGKMCCLTTTTFADGWHCFMPPPPSSRLATIAQTLLSMQNTPNAKQCWDTLGHAVIQTCGAFSQSKKPLADQILKARQLEDIQV